MKTQLILLFFLLGNVLAAQQSMLIRITMANVDDLPNEPAVGVSVNSLDANEVETGENGICKLKFPRKKAGEYVSLSIGRVDRSGQPITLITEQYEKQKQFLRNNPDDNQLNILVCRPEDYAEIFSGYNSTVQAMFKGVSTDEINNQVLDTLESEDSPVAIETTNKSNEVESRPKASYPATKPDKKKKNTDNKKELENTKDSNEKITTSEKRKLPAPSRENKSKPQKNNKNAKINPTTLEEDIYNVTDLETDRLVLDNKIDEAVKRHKAKALDFEIKKDFVNAAKHYEEICKIYEKSNSEKSKLISAYEAAAHAFFNADLLDEARGYYKRGLQTVLYKNGPDHIRLSTFHSNLANTYFADEKYELAVDSYEDGIAVIERNFGETSYMHLFPLHRIAICYQKMNKLKKAEKYYLKTLDIIEKGENMSYADINNTINNIIIFYENQKTKDALNEAIKYYELLDEWHNHFDDEHQVDRAKLWMDMARTLVVAGQYEKADITAVKAKNLFNEIEGSSGSNYRKAERLLIRIEMAKNAGINQN